MISFSLTVSGLPDVELLNNQLYSGTLIFPWAFKIQVYVLMICLKILKEWVYNNCALSEEFF